MARPTKYKKEFCQEIIDFFDQEPYTQEEIPHYKNGQVAWVDKKLKANDIPTLRNFAKKIGVGVSTVYDWCDEKHSSFQKEFSDAFTRAKEIRKWFLIQNGLHGLYNPSFAIFTAKNITDMEDKSQHDVNNTGSISLNKWVQDNLNKKEDDK